QYAKDNGLKVLPYCPFVAAYLERHPEWNDIVGQK
ncbi:MAG: N-acetyltransferase, partial [Bacteroidota bacterium]